MQNHISRNNLNQLEERLNEQLQELEDEIEENQTLLNTTRSGLEESFVSQRDLTQQHRDQTEQVSSFTTEMEQEESRLLEDRITTANADVIAREVEEQLQETLSNINASLARLEEREESEQGERRILGPTSQIEDSTESVRADTMQFHHRRQQGEPPPPEDETPHQRDDGGNWWKGLIGGVVALIAIIFLIIFLTMWAGENEEREVAESTPTEVVEEDEEEPANNNADNDTLFGLPRESWTQIESNGWVYGPNDRATIEVPEGHRVDYDTGQREIFSCGDADGDGPGVYGPTEVNAVEATVWHVEGEEECPPHSEWAQAQAEENTETNQAALNSDPTPTPQTEEEDEDQEEVADPTPVTDEEDEEIASVSQNNSPSESNTATSSEGGGVEFTLGCGDKNVGAVKELIGLDVVCLGTEYDAYTWRSAPMSTDATLPDGWIGTLHLSDDRIIVTEEPGKYSIVAGTFRRKSGYPSGDAVHDRCRLLEKEQEFGASQNPSFEVHPHGFSCEGGETIHTEEEATNASSESGSGCPTSPSEAATLVGGSADNWSEVPGSEGTGWKYGPGSETTLTAPEEFGRIDHPGGTLRNGDSASANEATLWCEG